MPNPARLLIGTLIGLVSCGGGGGGGGPSLPAATVSTAAFVGIGATPTAGDSLILFLSQNVTVTGAVLDDTDVVLSNGTLGAITTAPAPITSRAVAITLGTGVSFTPGATTIAFAAGNDAVRGSSGTAPSGAAVAITAGDGDTPSVTALTLDAIPAALNGTGAAGGVLQVPRTGFTIDVDYTDANSAIDTSKTSITASVAVATGAGTLAAGDELRPHMTATLGVTSSSYLLPSTTTFPAGNVTITVYVVDQTGMSSAAATFAFRVVDSTPALRPFEAGQAWYLDTTRDIESYTHDPTPTTPEETLVVNNGANGRSDLEDLYFVLGVFGGDSAVNNTMRTAINDAVAFDLSTFYSGTSVTFSFASLGTFPSANTAVPYANASFSQICIAGSHDAAGSSGVLGLAIFDPNNDTQENNCALNFAGSRLGVFLHPIIESGLASAPSGRFRLTYNAFAPGLGGTPIGGDPADDDRLAGVVQDARTTAIANALARTAAMIAVITAHECGHSVGLVQDGPMPAGLYGGDAVHFPGSTSGHINNDNTMFPGAAQNIMSPGISFAGATDPGTAFNALNLAYLRERALYDRP